MYELLKLACLSCNYHWLPGGGGGGLTRLLEEVPPERGYLLYSSAIYIGRDIIGPYAR